MKLPNINKPPSASSTNRQIGTNIGNLERNLFNKLNEYDEINKIEKKIEPKKSKDTPIYSTTINESKGNGLETKYNPQINNVTKISQTLRINNNKTSNNNSKNIPLSQQDNLFLTHNQHVKSEGSIEENENNLSSDEDEILQKSKILDKQKKVMLNYDDDSEVGQLNQLLCQTDIDINEQFESICTLKNTITQMNNSIKSVGYGIQESLMAELKKDFEEMMRLQRESQAIDEYTMNQSNRVRMPFLRSGSVNQQKKQKK